MIFCEAFLTKRHKERKIKQQGNTTAKKQCIESESNEYRKQNINHRIKATTQQQQQHNKMKWSTNKPSSGRKNKK